VSETTHVNVCMFKLKHNNIHDYTTNTNIGLREYPVEVWVIASPEFSLSPIVSDLNRCSHTQSMQAEDHNADPL
jgi:hypothetical protein